MATLPPETIPPQAATLPADSAASEALAEALVALHGQAAGLALLARLGPERVEIGGELAVAVAAPVAVDVVAGFAGDDASSQPAAAAMAKDPARTARST